ncbi:alpha/beta fold hydrolase [Acinetobacter baumannii]|uniref:alpha/beta fold hydrolase n=1 Tax=Acinetobacter calcoaceticus/baumannii complex TaxID=909768 RepID=UPI0013BA8883|nr:alpha/beta hydrolase [Acinetobacter baumannii]NDX18459.1 alpha/beta hydrolase [Acinetobacter baumannii]NDX37861.1 alpha/beta hydrolase [Acinetobacter baumannii]
MKKKLIFLSGLLCDATIWQKQIDFFSAEYDVSAFEFSHLDNLKEMAAMVIKQLDSPSIVVGHSMGARVALEVFRAAPELVSKLALLDFGIHPKKPGEAEKRYALIEETRQQGMQYLIKHWLESMVYEPNIHQSSIFEPMKAMVLSKDIESFKAQINALLNRPNVEALFKDINIPLYLGVGRQDQWSTLAQHQEMKECNPSASLFVYENSGHMSPLEAADQVNQSLKQWLHTYEQA